MTSSKLGNCFEKYFLFIIFSTIFVRIFMVLTASKLGFEVVGGVKKPQKDFKKRILQHKASNRTLIL